MLALHLTGSRAASFTAGVVFAFAPYRFEHYMHMELQWTVWVPWAFWALHRTFETGSRRYAGRRILLIAIPAVLLLEYWVAPLRLIPYPNTPPPLYGWLARQPVGVVAEFPMPFPDALPGNEPRYAYMSTFHWMPTINGYSGYYPVSYVSRLEALRNLPDEVALRTLKRDDVRDVILHTSLYEPDRLGALLSGVSANPSIYPPRPFFRRTRNRGRVRRAMTGARSLALGLRSIRHRRDLLSRRTYGLLAGLIGVGAWLWSRQRGTAPASPERGTVIFHNTPEPTPLSDDGVI